MEGSHEGISADGADMMHRIFWLESDVDSLKIQSFLNSFVGGCFPGKVK